MMNLVSPLTVAKFITLGHAIAYLNEQNPARAKSINFLEPDTGSTIRFADFDPNHPEMIFSGIANAVKVALVQSNYEEAKCWEWRNLGDRTGHLDVVTISEKLRISTQKVYKNLRYVNDRLRAQLIARGLLEPDERVH